MGAIVAMFWKQHRICHLLAISDWLLEPSPPSPSSPPLDDPVYGPTLRIQPLGVGLLRKWASRFESAGAKSDASPLPPEVDSPGATARVALTPNRRDYRVRGDPAQDGCIESAADRAR